MPCHQLSFKYQSEPFVFLAQSDFIMNWTSFPLQQEIGYESLINNYMQANTSIVVSFFVKLPRPFSPQSISSNECLL